MSEHGIINGVAQTETARRFVVFQVLKDFAGAVHMVPLMAFDTEPEATEFEHARGAWLGSLTAEAKDLMARLGIAACGVVVRGLQTPGAARKIAIADPSVLSRLPRPA